MIDHYLVTESGRITYDIYNRTMFSSPWIRLPRKVEWTQRMGAIMQNVMWERPVISGTEEEWTTIALNDNSGNTCHPPTDEIIFKQTRRNMQLKHKAVHSPRFCLNDLLFTEAREKQVDSLLANLAEQVRHYWIKFNREEWTDISRKVIVEGTLSNENDESTPYFPAVEPTSILTQGVLDYIYNLLTIEQAGRHQLSMQNGRPIYGLITDQLTARQLIRADNNIREDFRYSSQHDMLLKPLGIRHTYNGFIYMMDEMPPRYNFNATAVESGSDVESTDPWEEVEPYVVDGDGVRQVNPAWLTAEYQDSFIYVKDAYRLRVPGQVNGIPRMEFKTQNYMGDFKWMNYANDDESSDAYNPDGNLGRFRGVLAAAVEPINPHVMFTLRHKVCQPNLGLLDCASL